jgi:outer membrane protein assembly factor BamB
MELTSQFAVVPIVVNAGAALLPALLAGVASIAALIFKPRELIRACRARPGVVLAVLSVVVGTVAMMWFWPAGSTGKNRTTRSGSSEAGSASSGLAPVTVDWTRVALARIAATKAGATVAPVASASITPAASGKEPFIFRGGTERLGSLGGEIKGPLQLAWQYYPRWRDNGVEQEDRDAMVLSSPAVWGDRVFGASCTLDPPDSFGSVFCLDAATGRQLWSVDQADGEPFKGFFSSPAISADGRYLVIGQGLHPDSNCRLVCLDPATGRVQWTVKVPLHIESSPYIEGDVVYVGAGAIEDPTTHKAMGHPGFVFAVRLSDGKELWRFDVNDPESSPAMRNGVLFIGSGFNGNAVVALKTGPAVDAKPALLWRAESPHPITGAVTLAGDLVFAGGGNGDFVFRDPNPAGIVLALQAADGKPSWQAVLPDAVLGAVAASERLICPVASGQVVALDIATGKVVWTNSVSGNAPVLAAAAVTKSEVFAVSQNGYLGRLRLDTGESIERIYLNATDKPGEQGLSISSPLVVGGRLFVGSETGGLRCYVGGAAQ